MVLNEYMPYWLEYGDKCSKNARHLFKFSYKSQNKSEIQKWLETALRAIAILNAQ